MSLVPVAVRAPSLGLIVSGPSVRGPAITVGLKAVYRPSVRKTEYGTTHSCLAHGSWLSRGEHAMRGAAEKPTPASEPPHQPMGVRPRALPRSDELISPTNPRYGSGQDLYKHRKTSAAGSHSEYKKNGLRMVVRGPQRTN